VAKALEKVKSRRYASAGDLASDIRRYLRGEAILARPASALYQIRKFAWRHRALVAGVSGIFSALVVGTVVSILFAVRAAENARVATARERVATYESYRARIAAAAAAISLHDVAETARQLDAAAEPLREWEWRHLRARIDDSIALFPANGGEPQYLISNPNGIRIARLTRASLRITDLDGHEVLARAFGPETHLMYHPPLPTRRGLRLIGQVRETQATGLGITEDDPRWSNILNVMDDHGHVETKLTGPAGMGARLVAMSLDGSRVAVCWANSTKAAFAVHDIDSSQPAARFAHDIDMTHALVFSPDGTRVATGGEDGLTRLWDTSTGMMTALCRGHTRKVLSVSFRGDGLRLATASSDGTVRQWDSTTGREVEPPYDLHTGEVLTAKYSFDGTLIASGGTDRTVRVWDAANRQDLGVLQGHFGDVGDLAFTADGRRLASVSKLARSDNLEQEDGTVRLWEVANHGAATVLRGHTSYVYPVAYSPDGQWIASGSWDSTVRLWDTLTMESVAILPHPGRIITALAFSPDSSWLVCGSNLRESMHIWNVATVQCERTFEIPGSVVAQA
jgi:WD40 repeat protein